MKTKEERVNWVAEIYGGSLPQPVALSLHGVCWEVGDVEVLTGRAVSEWNYPLKAGSAVTGQNWLSERE